MFRIAHKLPRTTQGQNFQRVQIPPVVSHSDRVMQELKDLGVSKRVLWAMESRYLHHIIHEDEHIGGIVYGKHGNSFAMLVATDKRVIFLDKKPLFMDQDELTYDVVSGVRYTHAGLASNVTLHTRLGDYAIVTINEKCGRNFVDYIEQRRLEQPNITSVDQI